MKRSELRQMIKEELIQESDIIQADNAIFSAMIKYRKVLAKEKPEALNDFRKIKDAFEKSFTAFDKKWGL